MNKYLQNRKLRVHLHSSFNERKTFLVRIKFILFFLKIIWIIKKVLYICIPVLNCESFLKQDIFKKFFDKIDVSYESNILVL